MSTSPTQEQIDAFKAFCKESCVEGEDCPGRYCLYKKKPLPDGRKVSWYMLFFRCVMKKKAERRFAYPV